MFDFIQNPRDEKSDPLAYAALVLILAVLYILAAKVRIPLALEHSIVSVVIFGSEGIALGMALFFGAKVWPGIFIGQFIVALTGHIGVLPSLEISIVNSAEAVLAVYLFNRYRLDNQLRHLRDVLGLMMLIVLVLQPFSAIGGSTALWLHGTISGHEYLQTMFSWWFGNVMGQILFTPFVLLMLHHYRQIRPGEFLLYGLVFAGYLYWLDLGLVIQNPSLLLTLTVPVVIWIVSRKGLTYGTFLSIIIAVISSYSVFRQTGAFSSESLTDNIININFYILANVSAILISGILIEERKRNEQRLQEKVAAEVARNKEQQALMFQQSRLAQMGEMIAMIAHQWRQPLNNLALVNQTIVMKFRRNKLDEEAIKSFHEKSKELIGHMSETINDFRNFFRSEKEKQNFCVTEMVEKVISITESLGEMHQIRIDLETGDEPLYTYGYPNEFSQAILNLLTNARDALVENAPETKWIKLRIQSTEREIIVTVEDNAGGIPEANMEKIFDPYFSTKEDKNGTGLGLYMVKMIIVEHMQSDIQVTNTESGARFTITLPKGSEA